MNGFQEKREIVEGFLYDLKNILNSKNYKLDILNKKKNEAIEDMYTNINTLLSLNYDMDDVKNELLELELKHYSETLYDNNCIESPCFYVFYKIIQGKMIYIKIKIKNKKLNIVFCISFHFAKYNNIKLPYA